MIRRQNTVPSLVLVLENVFTDCHAGTRTEEYSTSDSQHERNPSDCEGCAQDDADDGEMTPISRRQRPTEKVVAGLATVFSIPDALTDWRRPRSDFQSTQEQRLNRKRDDQLNRLAVFVDHGDDAVAIPLVNGVDDSSRPALDIVCRLSGMQTVVVHTAKTHAPSINCIACPD